MTGRSSTDLPHEIADRITKPFAQFPKIEARQLIEAWRVDYNDSR